MDAGFRSAVEYIQGISQSERSDARKAVWNFVSEIPYKHQGGIFEAEHLFAFGVLAGVYKDVDETLAQEEFRGLYHEFVDEKWPQLCQYYSRGASPDSDTFQGLMAFRSFLGV